jgi:hypothetical protein
MNRLEMVRTSFVSQQDCCPVATSSLPASKRETEDIRETRTLVAEAGDPEGTFTPAALPVGHSSEAPGQGVGLSVIHILDIQNITSKLHYIRELAALPGHPRVNSRAKVNGLWSVKMGQGHPYSMKWKCLMPR